MTSVKCLATGCALITHLGQAWGDLHLVGDTYVFNAVLDRHGETNWTHKGIGRRALVIPENRDFFERRGVIVVDARLTFPNEALADYIFPEHPEL